MMQLIKKFQWISLIVFMTGFVFFTSPVYAQDLFEEYQSIPTQGGADFESFTIGSDTYLAVANSFNGDTYNLDSKIYKRYRAGFVEIQSIPTQGAGDWEYFTIGSDTYLAVANNWDGTIWNLDSKIYKWNGYEFKEFQSIPTQGGVDWEYFTIGSDTYLAVANQYNGSTWNLDSKIYKWNGSAFEEHQSIPTQWAFVCESFTIGSDTYLAVANRYNDSTHNIDSKIYKWNGSAFEEYQSIPTQGAVDFESFTIGTDTYLAVANWFNDSTCNLDSKIYKWDGRTGAFVERQSIPTHGAGDWESFTIGSATFLAVANWNNDTTFNIDSKIYAYIDPVIKELVAIAPELQEDATGPIWPDYIDQFIEMLYTFPPLDHLNNIAWSLYDIALNVTDATQKSQLISVFENLNLLANKPTWDFNGSPYYYPYLISVSPLDDGKGIAIDTVLKTVIKVLSEIRPAYLDPAIVIVDSLPAIVTGINDVFQVDAMRLLDVMQRVDAAQYWAPDDPQPGNTPEEISAMADEMQRITDRVLVLLEIWHEDPDINGIRRICAGLKDMTQIIGTLYGAVPEHHHSDGEGM